MHNINSNLHKAKPTRKDETEIKKTWITSSYIWVKDESLIKKLRQNFKEKITIISRFNDAKVFCSNKDKIKFEQKSNVIYEFICPGCNRQYIGRTDICIITRLNEHAEREDQP